MRKYEEFTNLYSLSKTLRMGLLPIGATAAHIVRDEILKDDQHRAESYLKMKKIIDCYHKYFIDDTLSHLTLDSELLRRFQELYRTQKKEEKNRKEFEDIQTALRKHIVKRLTSGDAYKRLFKEKLIQEDLAPFLEIEDNGVAGTLADNLALINEFKGFTTYFQGFNQNRENMYSDEAKSTAIAYRLIHDNLPKFIDNIGVFEKIATVPELRENLEQVYADCEEYLNVCSIDEAFSLDNYSMVLIQKHIDAYNMIIGGRAEKKGEKKIQGINEYVNLYNQKQEEKANKLPKLKPLFKQILSDREVISWLPEAFENDNDVLMTIRKAYTEFFEGNACIAEQLKELLCNLGMYSAQGIYMANDLQLTDISQQMTDSWQTIKQGLCELVKLSEEKKKKESDEDYNERVAKMVKSLDNVSIAEIDAALKLAGATQTIEQYFANLGAINTEEKQEVNIFARINNAFTDAESLLSSEYPENKNLAQSEKDVEKIKTLLDAIKDLQHFVKPLLGKNIQGDKDERFYSELFNCWTELDKFTPLYSKVRNYMTKKPYSTKKIKLNFDIPNLLNGFVDSKTDKSDNGTQYGGYLFRKKNSIGEYDYYLGISKDRKMLRYEENAKGAYERLDYYQLKAQTLMGKGYVRGDFKADKLLLINAIRRFAQEHDFQLVERPINGEISPKSLVAQIKGDKELYPLLLQDEQFAAINSTVIAALKQTLLNQKRVTKAMEYGEMEYELFSDVQDAIADCEGKVFNYFPVSDEEMEDVTMRVNKPLYLFQIVNKDLLYANNLNKRKSRGRDNLHTMYFKALMSGTQDSFDIGTGEVFFREQSIGDGESIESQKPTHKRGELLQNKNKENKNKTSSFPYDLYKDKRYREDKYQLHLSIVQNYKANEKNNVNDEVNEYIAHSEDLHIIGIDRGERHLLYITVIDLKGNIKKQFSLNKVVNEYNGNKYETNYHDLLETREKERLKSRLSWKSIETIKDLKEGYLSQVIHKITELMIEYHAIVVLEDLNMGFMRGRQKVEMSVYQKFEKMLIDKMAYLVDKKQEALQPAGIMNALQLVNNPSKDKSKSKQNGFLFYIPAWNTSKIDPVTGFANLFSSDDLKYTSVKKATSFFGKFDAIRYNADKDLFEFKFSYQNFESTKTRAEGTKEDWTLCSYGKRIKTFRNSAKNSQWDNEEFDLTVAFKTLLESYGIDIHGNIKEAIMSKDNKFFGGQDGHGGFCFLFKMLLQMRNSITGTDVDYLISPVADADGNFFDSSTEPEGQPHNADANGAYNIARKGLMAVRQIKETTDLKNLKFDISNKAWLAFAQTKPYLND